MRGRGVVASRLEMAVGDDCPRKSPGAASQQLQATESPPAARLSDAGGRGEARPGPAGAPTDRQAGRRHRGATRAAQRAADSASPAPGPSSRPCIEAGRSARAPRPPAALALRGGDDAPRARQPATTTRPARSHHVRRWVSPSPALVAQAALTPSQSRHEPADGAVRAPPPTIRVRHVPLFRGRVRRRAP